MQPESRLVIFVLDDQRYALYLSAVERVIPAVAITRLPHAPDIVLGVINVQGHIIPVMNVRNRFGLPVHALNHNDQFIIARTSKRPVAMIVDKVHAVTEYSEDALVPADTILPGIEYVEGVAKLEDGIVLIHDLDKFLSLEEQHSLDQALTQADDSK